MSKPALDSDLYGDIYGDDDTDYPQPETGAELEPLEDDVPEESPPSPVAESNAQQPKKPPPATQDAHRSLPPKPMSPNSLSYSAQVAQQFSVYQQTPSQERQQRAEIPLPQNPRTAGAAAVSSIPRHDPTSTDSVFGKKPSEMHDSGYVLRYSMTTRKECCYALCRIRSISIYEQIPATILRYLAPVIASVSFFVSLASIVFWVLIISLLRSLLRGPLQPRHTIHCIHYDRFTTTCPFRTPTVRLLANCSLAVSTGTQQMVDACTIMRDPSGTSRGFAFLTFEDANAVNAVVAQDHVLDGKAIDPKRAIPREEHLRNTRYFVGGLSPTTTSESMKEFFSAYGKVVDATVMVDRESGRSKGFGFVTYEDASNADQLVGKIGLILDDKQIEVKMAQPRSQRDQARAAAATPISGGRDSASNFSNQSTQGMANIPFTPQQQQQQQPNQMAMMFQRPMGQVPMMGGNMPMMNMNPMMAAMGMGMGGFNPMGGMGGMNMMAGMNGMNNMGAAGMGGMGNMNAMGGGMANMGAMRLGMGPMGMGTGMGAGGMGTGMAGTGMAGGMGNMAAMAMGMRPNMSGMSAGAVNPNFGRTINAAATTGPGPARITSRGQHSFHPYSR
ncbi:hypothetical protein H0H81_000189 [Sphagnurus paluster]|uniref:RRM domain-containing protein n=1 Tax=Sphagnurus paluster TaxID=117069 RepID=A0A9P7G0T5_9AGAR|nr:hypothetical protein H0H81_000189 [Sphagnurus paluster]